ncbi:MAG: class II aldolase/adducin family protein [Gammaproteobacteria bacterium]|nr:class II aldolase/adducin family protein [Gammaproteobacteria bacterium]
MFAPHLGSSPVLIAEREAIALAGRRLAAAGLVLGTAGNLSLRSSSRIAVTATGAALAELTADQVSVVDRRGRLLHGGLAPTTELGLHLGIYRRYRAGAVVHTHAPWATALSCVIEELPCIHYQMLPLGGSVRVAPYRLFGTPELARVTLRALQDRRAALMANHGAICYADTLDQAIESALVLEFACALYWRAAQLGTPQTLDADQWREVAAHVRRLRYGAPRRARRG